MSAAAEDISAYDRMCWPADEIERALLSGAHRLELTAYFGRAEYERLAALARRAARPRRREQAHVYIVPGIMGSQLGLARTPVPDLLWIDPADIMRGRLVELHFSNTALKPLGVLVYSYLGLKLRLRAAGFVVTLYDYDWRRDIGELGAELGARLCAEPAGELMLVAHSMGGLLARVALRQGGERVGRVLMLGTPHTGSMSAVQALRGTYPVVGRLAAMDRRHDAEFLSAQIFRTFPSVYQLLPSLSGAPDLFDAAQWPGSGPQPEPTLLRQARDFLGRLEPADARCIAIAGTGQRTVSAVERRGEEFSYGVSAQGDGTVTVASAVASGCDAYYLRCEHSQLPRSAVVADALIDLLRHGRTRRLASQWAARRPGLVRVSDAQLKRAFAKKVDWAGLSAQRKRNYLNQLNQPPSAYRSRRRS